jgi:hypothetical protein
MWLPASRYPHDFGRDFDPLVIAHASFDHVTVKTH